MEKEVEIKNINLQIGKKEISLTVEEAKKLKAVLSTLFEEKTVVKEAHHSNNYEYKKYFWDLHKCQKFIYSDWGDWAARFSLADNTLNCLTAKID